MKRLVYVLVLLALLVPMAAFACLPDRPAKVTYCHAKPADTAKNGWNVITTNVNSVPKFKNIKNKHAGNHDADIIPPFSVVINGKTYSFGGKNMNTLFDGVLGRDILANGCKLPEYEPCSDTTGWLFSERVFVQEKPNGDKVFSDVYLKYDAQDPELVCARRAQIVIEKYETCSVQTDWMFFSTSEEMKPNGTIVKKHTYFKYDFFDRETICDTMIAVEREPYEKCSEVVVGEWTPWTGDGKDKTSYREYLDARTGALCNTEYRERCESQNFVHFWTDGFCKFRDLTYPLNASWMVNPPVFMQNAYCGCGYEPHGPWGIVEVGECDEDGYKYWTELPPYCGYQSCE